MTSAVRMLSAPVIVLVAMMTVCTMVIPDCDAATSGAGLEYESQNGSVNIAGETATSWTDVDTVKLITKNGSITLYSQQVSHLRTHPVDLTFEMSEPGTDGLSRNDANLGYKKVSLAVKDGGGNDYALNGYIKVRIPYELGYLENPDKISVKIR